MNYLRNAWYRAARGHEIGRVPAAMPLCEKLALLGKEDGGIVAMGYACLHRFSPLRGVRLHDYALACPHDKLQLGKNRRCLQNSYRRGDHVAGDLTSPPRTALRKEVHAS